MANKKVPLTTQQITEIYRARIPGNIVTSYGQAQQFNLDLGMKYVLKDAGEELIAAARKLAEQFQHEVHNDKGVVAQANLDALRTLQRFAAANLEAAMDKNQRFTRTRTKRLERAITNRKFSTYSAKGFQFLVYKSGILEEVPYYLAVERGSRASVGRYVPLLFLGKPGEGTGSYATPATPARELRTPRRPDPARNNLFRDNRGRLLSYAKGRSRIPFDTNKRTGRKNYLTDRIVGPHEDLYKGLKGKHFDRKNAFVVKIKRPVPAYHYARDAGIQFRKQNIWVNLMRERSRQFEQNVTRGIASTIQNTQPAGGAGL